MTSSTLLEWGESPWARARSGCSRATVPPVPAPSEQNRNSIKLFAFESSAVATSQSARLVGVASQGARLPKTSQSLLDAGHIMSSAEEEVPLRYVHFRVDGKKVNAKHQMAALFANNYISTTLYTVITFLPVNLYLQFNKKANLYFLGIAILSLFPLSPKPWWVSVLPLLFVLTVSAVKEAIEDWHRYLQDKQINSTLVLAWRDNAFTPIEWQHVVVGDILKVVENGSFPADMVLLQSSLSQGICNIETANLDGETNLKSKKARPATYNIECAADGSDYPSKFQCVTESDPPCENMESNGWKGNFHNLPGYDEPVALGMESMLLRGCTLRNTRWIIGQVIFTGKETKLFLNNKATVFKRSMVEKTVDTALYVIFAIQAVICSFGCGANYVWMNNNSASSWYLPPVSNISQTAGLSWFTYLVLLDILVPISLYVSIELVKVAQGTLINSDLTMYYAENDKPAQARTTSLNEELGQVDFIFSDKTGTLTRNQMEFLRCTIGKNAFGPGCMEAAGVKLPRLDSKVIPEFLQSKFRFEDNRLLDGLLNGHKDAALFDRYLTAMCVCHDVIAEYPGCEFEFADPAKLAKPHVHGRDQCTVKVVYQAASPDEKALVDWAREMQYYFQHRVAANGVSVGGRAIDDAQIVTCNLLGKRVEFQVLASLEFTSTRKRASVVVRDPRDNKIRIYSKGADGVLFPLLNKASQGDVWDFTSRELSQFSRVGLRTLLVACKELSEAEFVAWYDQLQKARSDMNNRAGMVANAEAAIERELELIGTTAIEDRLQDGVPECIDRLAHAGIKIWMLTGDKVETAINIGRSCKLITNDMVDAEPKRSLIVIDIDDRLSDVEARAQTVQALEDAWQVVKTHSTGQEGQGLVVSGRALGYVFPIRKLDGRGREIIPAAEVLQQEEALATQLYEIATRCKAVICCRVSPKQKAQVVLLVKERVQGVCLAIGDGANDCPMIKAAHVGIGISGFEGLQAVMASDYAIAQFSYLETLLFIHGARSYRRISLLILYSFYKNFCVALANIWFAFYSAFAGQIFYDALFGSCFNLFFTALPIMGSAVFNAPVSKQGALDYPNLYRAGQRFEAFNLKLLFWYLAEGLFQSLLIFFFSLYLFGDTVTDPSGRDNDLWVTSSAMFAYMVVVTNLKMALQCVTWTWITHLFFWLSIAAFVLVSLVYSGTSVGLSTTADMYWVTIRMYTQGMFWWGMLLVSIASLLPYLTVMYVQRMFYPTHEDIVYENELGHGERASRASAYDVTNTPGSPTRSHKSSSSSSHIELHSDDEKKSGN